MPPLIRYEIRITSGDHAGCYLGVYVGGGLVTNPEARDNPDVTVRGKRYSLFASERGHTMFGDKDEVNQIIAELKQQGYDAELIDTHDPNADTFENRLEKAVGFYLRPDKTGTTMVIGLNEEVLRKATQDDINKWNSTRSRMMEDENPK
jgi:hypothetical protein